MSTNKSKGGVSAPGPTPPFLWKRRLAWFVRWFHIYTSMLSLAAVLFFAATGFTLNHADWFYGGYEEKSTLKGTLDPALVKGDEESVDKLNVVEALRAAGISRGKLTDFHVDEGQCVIAFKGPGFVADAFVNRETGEFEIQVLRMGLVAVLNDLHKGRDSGPEWSILIDVSAVIMIVVSLSGLFLLFYIKRRLIPGMIVGAVGLLVMLAFWKFWVP